MTHDNPTTTPPTPFGPLRRKDRAITAPEELDAILHEGKVMHLALSADDRPFLVPVFYAYAHNTLYFHSAQAGTKIGILKRNNNVCFEISLDQGVIESELPCDFEARHRTVIGFGKAHFLETIEEKTQALDAIVARFTDRHFDYTPERLKHTAVLRIDIESLTGKKHGF